MRDRLLAAEKVKAIDWRDGVLYLHDLRSLPFEQHWIACSSAADVAEAIGARVVQGASVIGICAAYGVVLAARARLAEGGNWHAALEADFSLLAAARPTAANLFWALDRMRDRLGRLKDHAEPLAVLEAEAVAIHESDREANLTMAQLGVDLIRKHQGNAQAILTHCNTGALATGGFGTALGVIRGAFIEGMVERVYATETRPSLQGARLTAWELASEGVPVTLNVDSAAAHIMKTKGVTWLIVGADCVAANGDVASRIGTYQLAVCAMHHGVRFMVVAPSATIDLSLASGEDIPVEEGDGRELLEIGGKRIGAQVDAFNPVFDVTPADLIDVIVTEKGIIERPDTAKLAQLMCRKRLH
ncbi:MULTISPECIES: S-methyl-5-thioribose-1-phosphate isomerase [Pseudomonas]|uniref:S-methyl-5-thioribose-1-phosphate isomerase n=1 Tax=Pseudomonas TaxID=286 RepID=UPI001BECD566|nr:MULTISPECIES: S-methyl-5-thioribose-1-phosphate isomerase [Pseudomonas]MBT2338379.1 S-methyl-5-thioribose-1-phosphate isomerase [Pseudomonas fluorescens]MCD4528481.1 S-methyl-5-thioribose-1-phosphate isomerase [Pseudomonas sp. C3-2018]